MSRGLASDFVFGIDLGTTFVKLSDIDKRNGKLTLANVQGDKNMRSFVSMNDAFWSDSNQLLSNQKKVGKHADTSVRWRCALSIQITYD
jgi:molecular chaperone DnaK (HSP70)